MADTTTEVAGAAYLSAEYGEVVRVREENPGPAPGEPGVLLWLDFGRGSAARVLVSEPDARRLLLDLATILDDGGG